MKKVFAIILAVAILLTALPLVLISSASTADFDTIFANYENVASKTYFDNNTPVNTAGFVAAYDNVQVYAAGLGTREANYLKPLSVPGGSVTIELTADSAVETGLVVHKGQTANTYLTFYTSANMSDWSKVDDNKIASSESVCTTIAPTPNTTDYVLRKQRIADLPKETRYLKIEITTAAAWQPGLDYIDVYGPDTFSAALEGCGSVPVTVIEGYNDPDYAALKVSEANVKHNGGALNYRADTSYFNPTGNYVGHIAIKADSTNVIETVYVMDEAPANVNSMLAKFYYTADISDPSNIQWTELSDDSVAVRKLSSADGNGSSLKNSATYVPYAYRLYNLPSETVAVKLEFGKKGWAPVIDYVDIYGPDVYFTCMEGYGAEPDISIEGYNDSDYASLKVTEANVKNNAGALNFREERNYFNPTQNNSMSHIAFKVDDTDLVDTLVVLDEAPANVNSMSVKFYYSTNVRKVGNIVWGELPDSSIAAKKLNNSNAAGSSLKNSKTYTPYGYRLFNLPKGTQAVKIEFGTKSWAPVIDFVDIYKSAPAIDKVAQFNSLTDGYEVINSLLNATETLDSKAVIGYKNWRFAKAGLNFRDEYSTQRPSGVNEDAEIIISVSDDTITEVASVINEGKFAITSNKYFASADGKTWSELSEECVYTREYTVDDELPSGYVGVKSGYVARVERIVRLPKGTTELKIVTSTNNIANSWWQPGVEYIDIYEPVSESRLAGYEQDYELITENSGLESEKIADHKNLIYTDNGVYFKDNYSLTRETEEESSLTLKLGDNTPVEFAYTVYADSFDKFKVKYLISSDGVNFTEVSSDNILSRKVTYLTDSALTEEYSAQVDLVTGLSKTAKYIKVEILDDEELFTHDVQVNYVKLYKVYIDPFDTVLNGYDVVETLLTTTNTIESQSIVSYKGWNKFGLVGMPFIDEVGTQRLSGDTADAEIIVSVDDKMAIEVATVVAKSLEGITSNKYYVSSNGKTWTELDASKIYSKRFTKETDKRLNETHVGLIERIVGLPEGATQLKVVTSTENKVNSWWQPSINRINLYKDPFDTAVDGLVVVDNAVTQKDKLSGERVILSKNYKYSDELPYINKGGALAATGKGNAELVLSIVDSMTVEFATVGSDALYPHTYYVSKDNKNWTVLSPENIFTRTFENVEGLGTNTAVVTRIDSIPSGSRYLKIVSERSNKFSVNYVKFYDKQVDKFDLAFVGMGRTDTLFNAVRKLNDTLVISYENWHYGTNGYTYIDDYSLQRDSENCSDGSLVIAVRDNQALEFGAIISNSWLKKTVTEYYVSEDGTNFKKLDADNVLKRYVSAADDSRVKEGYTVLKERLVDLPEGTLYVKLVVSTANEKNSWWQPGIDYVDIYTPYENVSLEQIAAQIGTKDTSIQFTSGEDGLENGVIISSKNWEVGQFKPSYTDGYSARRLGYDDAEIILSVNEDAIIELATVIDNSLEFCAENKFFTSVDGETYLPFDAGMLLTSKVTEGVTEGSFALVQLLSELPSDTKFVKIVCTTNGVTNNYKKYVLDNLNVYKGESTFKVRAPIGGEVSVMLVGNFMNIQLPANYSFTVDDLTDMCDSGKSLIYYYTADGTEVCDGTSEVESGMKLVLKRNNKTKKEYVISVTYLEGKDVPIDTPNESHLNVWLIIGIAAAVLVAATAAVVLFIIKKKRRN